MSNRRKKRRDGRKKRGRRRRKDRGINQENEGSKITTEKRKRDEDDERLVKRAMFDDVRIVLEPLRDISPVSPSHTPIPISSPPPKPNTNIIFDHQPSSPTHSVISNLSGSMQPVSDCQNLSTPPPPPPTPADPMLELHLNTLKLVKQTYKTNNLLANINQTFNTLAQHVTPSALSSTKTTSQSSTTSSTTTHCTYKLTPTGLLSSRTYPPDYDTKSVLDQRCTRLIPHGQFLATERPKDATKFTRFRSTSTTSTITPGHLKNEPSTNIIKSSPHLITSPFIETSPSLVLAFSRFMWLSGTWVNVKYNHVFLDMGWKKKGGGVICTYVIPRLRGCHPYRII